MTGAETDLLRALKPRVIWAVLAAGGIATSSAAGGWVLQSQANATMVRDLKDEIRDHREGHPTHVQIDMLSRDISQYESWARERWSALDARLDRMEARLTKGR